MHSYTAFLWSDSTVVLSWIQENPNRWKTFVCNRTTEILQYTTPSQWRHCPSTDNLADHLTLGTLPSATTQQYYAQNGVSSPHERLGGESL
ncbi:uncharacterized protein TNIN_289731 [Trichonephila inaurata madagascariensis]|uniref:Uncharacterized protein n=1 Tax=Trichonephila inaurata madagascariensis TaxID=2747483 RepID=A0A8X6MI77_9ARAC|nr:uncharacterized protein TNIN_289731 [Trichonephila inaurata madagascariensis]